jgi:hypothetical protein
MQLHINQKMLPKIKKMDLSLLKTRWHLGRRASKNVNKNVPWAPIAKFFLIHHTKMGANVPIVPH